MVSVAQVRAFADRGLEGDRFFRDSWAAAKRPDKAVSLIEQEILEMAASEHHVTIAGDKTRRNIITRGVPLIELLDRDFMVGDVVCAASACSSPAAIWKRFHKFPEFFARWKTAAV